MPDSGAPPRPACEVCVRLLGRPSDVRAALGRVMGALDVIACPDDRATVELVLAEVLNNIVEHARPHQPPRLIRLWLSCDGMGLRCTALDNGGPIPGHVLPPGHHPRDVDATAELAEGGYGWFLIRQLTRDLAYERDDHANRLSFRIPVGRIAAGYGHPVCNGGGAA